MGGKEGDLIEAGNVGYHFWQRIFRQKGRMNGFQENSNSLLELKLHLMEFELLGEFLSLVM